MMFKLKIKILKYVNRILYLFNLNLDLSIKKEKLKKILFKLKPFYLGYDLIRIGSNNDGGYLLPDILDQIKVCFSPGTGNNINFEKDLIKRGIKTYLADGTINESRMQLKDFNFIKKNISSFESCKTITLENWVNSQNISSNDMLLQMDIESSEYEVLHSTPEETLKKFKVIIIEFHYIEKISNIYFYQNFNNVLDKLLLNFEICHIHPNNCQGTYSLHGIELPTAIEVTFLRKDLCKNKVPVTNLPHELDQKNITILDDVFLPKEIINN